VAPVRELHLPIWGGVRVYPGVQVRQLVDDTAADHDPRRPGRRRALIQLGLRAQYSAAERSVRSFGRSGTTSPRGWAAVVAVSRRAPPGITSAGYFDLWLKVSSVRSSLWCGGVLPGAPTLPTPRIFARIADTSRSVVGSGAVPAAGRGAHDDRLGRAGCTRLPVQVTARLRRPARGSLRERVALLRLRPPTS